MKQKLMYCSILFLTAISVVVAGDYADTEHKFSVTYNNTDWETSTVLSGASKFSLASLKRNENRRPYVTFNVDVFRVDEQIPLEKYIRNNVKVASVAWKIVDEKTLDNLGAENFLFQMQHKIGNRSNNVQRLIAKANGNVYDVSCTMIEAAKSDYDSACSELITSFKLLP